MEKLAKKLASNIAVSLRYDDEKEAVISYGLTAIMQISLTVLLVLLFGLLVGAPVEALIVCFSASILRKFSGGAHAVAAGLCTFISTVYCTLTAYISRKLLFEISSHIAIIAAIVVIFGLSFLIVYKYAPVDSPNKPIKTEKKIKRMRRGSFLLLSIYLTLSVLMFVLGFKFEFLNSYAIGLLFGVSWQVFTLTCYGSILLNKFNNLYMKLRKEASR